MSEEEFTVLPRPLFGSLPSTVQGLINAKVESDSLEDLTPGL